MSDDNVKDFLASIVARPLLDAAVSLKIQHEIYISTLVEQFGFAEEEAIAIAEEKLNQVNDIGEEYFHMKKEGKTGEEIAQIIFKERIGEDE